MLYSYQQRGPNNKPGGKPSEPGAKKGKQKSDNNAPVKEEEEEGHKVGTDEKQEEGNSDKVPVEIETAPTTATTAATRVVCDKVSFVDLQLFST